jgi:cytoskeletal protein CcmA (bactofilin family)
MREGNMSEPMTIIGTNTFVNGNLEGDEDLTVEGRVEGSINLSKTLTVEVGGVVRANINVRNAVVSGILVGNVTAQESVHVTEQGRVVGDISAPRVILVDGASFRGNIDMGDFDVDRATEGFTPKAARKAPARVGAEEPVAAEEKGHVERPQAVRTRPAPIPTRRPAAAPPKPAAPVKAAQPSPAAAAETAVKRSPPPPPKVRAIGKTKAVKKKH